MTGLLHGTMSPRLLRAAACVGIPSLFEVSHVPSVPRPHSTMWPVQEGGTQSRFSTGKGSSVPGDRRYADPFRTSAEEAALLARSEGTLTLARVHVTDSWSPAGLSHCGSNRPQLRALENSETLQKRESAGYPSRAH